MQLEEKQKQKKQKKKKKNKKQNKMWVMCDLSLEKFYNILLV